MSFFLHKGCVQVPVVNSEEEEASPPLYPYGRTPTGVRLRAYPLGVRRACAGQRHPRTLRGPPCRAVFHRNVVAPIPDKTPGTTSNKPSSISRKVSAIGSVKHFAGRVPGRWDCRGVAGCWFGVSGSWSRMRHQSAAAGWSSGGSGSAAAAAAGGHRGGLSDALRASPVQDGGRWLVWFDAGLCPTVRGR